MQQQKRRFFQHIVDSVIYKVLWVKSFVAVCYCCQSVYGLLHSNLVECKAGPSNLVHSNLKGTLAVQ